jgi:hypothetical protein
MINNRGIDEMKNIERDFNNLKTKYMNSKKKKEKKRKIYCKQ